MTIKKIEDISEITIQEIRPHGEPDTEVQIRVPHSYLALTGFKTLTPAELKEIIQGESDTLGEGHRARKIDSRYISGLGEITVVYKDDTANIGTDNYRDGTHWVDRVFLRIRNTNNIVEIPSDLITKK